MEKVILHLVPHFATLFKQEPGSWLKKKTQQKNHNSKMSVRQPLYTKQL